MGKNGCTFFTKFYRPINLLKKYMFMRDARVTLSLTHSNMNLPHDTLFLFHWPATGSSSCYASTKKKKKHFYSLFFALCTGPWKPISMVNGVVTIGGASFYWMLVADFLIPIWENQQRVRWFQIQRHPSFFHETEKRGGC